jgi:hypothetical protein
MLDQLDSMWAYSTQNWLRHTMPDGDTNQSRWDTFEVWQVAQAATMYHTEAEPATRPKKVELDAHRLMMGFVGNATSWAARLVLLYETMRRAEAEGMQLDVADGVPETVIGEDGAGFLSWAYEPMQDYLTERKRATFYGVTRLKLKRLGRQLKLTA